MLLGLLEEILATNTALEAGLPLAAHLLDQTLPDGLERQAVEQAERLLRAVNELGPRGAMVEVMWDTVAKAMAAKGEVLVSVDSALAMVRRHSARGERLLRWLLGQGYVTEVWTAVASALEQPGIFELQWPLRRIKLIEAVPPEPVLEWVGPDERRGRAVARLVGLRRGALGPLPRGLLSRFGAAGSIAGELKARALSISGAGGDILEFYEQQRSYAEQWANDSAPHIRSWAQQVIAELERAIADEQIEQQARQQYA